MGLEATSPDGVGIVPFDGYGTRRRIRCGGRVLDRKGIVKMHEDDTVLDNLRKMVRRYLSRPRGGTSVRVEIEDHESVVTSDREGFFEIELTAESPTRAEESFQRVAFELVEPRLQGPIRAVGRSFVPPPTARFGVISDIDDTIVRTNATDRLRMARIVLFGNAQTRLPFSGVRAFYKALRDGPGGKEDNPFFYISSSSWHLYDVLRDFMSFHRMPPGPLILRRMPFNRESLFGRERHGHKRERIAEVLRTYPELPFLLIGDSGQHDAEIYSDVVERFPRRILSVYLRDVHPAPARKGAIAELAASVEGAGSELRLVDTTLEAAEHAASRELIASDRLTEIERDEIRDEPDAVLPRLLSELAKAAARKTRPRRWRKRRSGQRSG